MRFPTLTLAKVFFLELMRDRWIIGAFVIGIILFLISKALGSLSMEQQQRVIFHLSVSGIQVVGVVLAVILGVSTLHKEVEKQTCLLILSRPVSRAQFLVGKVLALSIFLLVYDAILGLSLVALMDGTYSFLNFALILLLTWFEQVLVLMFAIFGSLFMGRAVAGLLAFGVMLLGHWIPDMEYFAKKSENPVFMGVSKVVSAGIPHFFQMNRRSIYFLLGQTSELQWGWAVAHFTGWFILLVMLSIWLWGKKDLV